MLKKILDRIAHPDGSTSISNPALINSFTDNPEFPYLVSFSRTGSHWLRMIMELYFEKPSLVRAFYFKKADDFTCYHTHDMELELRRENVIYLYRNPVETIYSQLRYYNENLDDVERCQYWADLYARHLSKWLVRDDFTRKKTVLTYEGMKSDMAKEFAKVCQHFDQALNLQKLSEVLKKVSKEELKKKTSHDQQVVNLSSEYGNERGIFKEKYEKLIFDQIYEIEDKLREFFQERS